MPKIILNVKEGELITLKKLLYLYNTSDYVSAVLQAIFEVARLGRPKTRATDLDITSPQIGSLEQSNSVNQKMAG